MSGEDLLATYIANEISKGFTLSPEYSYHVSGSSTINFDPSKYINELGEEAQHDQAKKPDKTTNQLKRKI